MKLYFMNKMFGLGFAFQVLCICCCIAQTRESDKYYQRGIDNVEAGQYKDALEAFKMCKIIDGNTISQDFNISNNSHEWLGFCYYKSNDVDNAKQYSDFYKYKPYNRLLISGIDTLYNKVIIFFKDGKYDSALDYLNHIEDILASKFGKNNIYLNLIWEQQASMHFGLNHYMAATNILTKIWNIYNDSIGPCYEWQKIGQKLIRCYSAEGKRDKAIQAEPLDSNTVKIRRTKTYETGLYFMKDSITPILLLPMEYRNVEKINDRFLFVTKDLDHHFIIDFSNWTFSKNITASSVSKYITDVDGVPVFSTYEKFIDFTGKTKENKYSFYVGTEGDVIKFELDSVFYTIPKDSIMQSNNKVKFIFPSETKSNDKLGDYYVQHIINKKYVVVHNRIDTEIGLLKRTDSGLIQLLPCDYSEIDLSFDNHHFIIKRGHKNYIFNSENLDKIEISSPIDGFGSDLTFYYNGRKTLFCGDYRPFAIDIEGNVYHFPIGSWVEQDGDRYVFHYGNDFVADINDISLGRMSEYRIKHNSIISGWRFTSRMDYPIDNSTLSNNVRCWMSSLLSGSENTYAPTYIKSPQRMFRHYAYNKISDLFINADGSIYSIIDNDSINESIYQEDHDAYRIWEDENYITYISGDAWFGGGAHGDSYTYYSTFSRKTGELLSPKDFINKQSENEVHQLIYDLIIEEQKKRLGYSEDETKSIFEFTPKDCPIGRLALTPNGVAFQYRAYELGGYGLGSFSFTIPYDKLNDILNLCPMSQTARNVLIESLKKANKHEELVWMNVDSKQNSLSLIKKKYGRNSGEYMSCLLQLANDSYKKDDFKSSLEYIQEYTDLITANMPSIWTTSQVQNTALKCYIKINDYKTAKKIGLEQLKRFNDTHYMNEMLDRYYYSELLSQIGSIYNQIGRADSALFYQEKSLYYGSEYDIEPYKKASLYAYKCKQYSKSNKLAKYVLWGSNKRESWMDKLINAFKEATSYNRMELRNKQIPWYQNFLPDLAYKTNDTIMVKSAYNGQLISKNLLLNTEQSLRSAILSSQDTTLINPYLSVQLRKKELVSIANDKNLKKEEKEEMASSVREEINKLERNLIDKSKLYGDYIKKLKIDIDQVSKYLRQGEMAIEFAVSSDSVYYALTIKGNNSIPQIIKLCTASELTSKKQDLFNTIWKPLLSNIDDVKTIYFSPVGELYNLPIEYANSTDNHTIGEKYEIYRLSSTREIVISRDSTYTNKMNANNAVLYGYLDYYADENYKSKTGSSIDNMVFNNSITTRLSKKGRGLRANVGRLEYSKAEIHDIDSLLVSNNYATVDSIFENSKGTETSLKNLTQKPMRILHLATHGFYITKKEMEDYKDFDFLSLDNVDTDEIEDKELVRSGLLFAGANHTLEGDGVIPDGCDDGILTALEVASLDLIGLDLVVLSACQTAQGDLGDDGVLGLQRGFKKAGANSILMSLWKVDDEATQILMTHFYKNLVSGQSKRQSLQSAQRYLREYNSGQYNKPEYWAAFILLDAIN